MATEEVVATSHVDRHGQALLPTALEGMARQLDKQPIRRLIEHDHTLPPVGKTVSGRVVTVPDGASALLVTTVELQPVREFRLPTGEDVVELAAETDRRPFVPRHDFGPGGLLVAIDPMNFGRTEDLRAFARELERIAPFEQEIFGRKALIPDPELMVRLPEQVLQHWEALVAAYPAGKIGKAVTDRLVPEIADDALRLYKFMKQAPIVLLKRAHPRNRPATCVYVVAGEPTVEFVVRSPRPTAFVRAIAPERLSELFAEARGYKEALGAVEVQYLFDEERGWEFNYLLTQTGSAIGTKRAIGRQRVALQLLMERASEAGADEGITPFPLADPNSNGPQSRD